ncbi:hypothetical protein DYB25_010993 [Aphanomyces astaci]|uniref:CAP N-terminal domain-containing protein n=1 Tax=Aphanomyces astaci TaxID=112090 RepID=A0A397AVJ3_APHAT|nr:hypothetical protein DYB25_010993 [Aphanomyces astaci]
MPLESQLQLLPERLHHAIKDVVAAADVGDVVDQAMVTVHDRLKSIENATDRLAGPLEGLRTHMDDLPHQWADSSTNLQTLVQELLNRHMTELARTVSLKESPPPDVNALLQSRLEPLETTLQGLPNVLHIALEDNVSVVAMVVNDALAVMHRRLDMLESLPETLRSAAVPPPPQPPPPPPPPGGVLPPPPQPPPSLQPHDNSLSPDSSSQQIQPLLDDAVHRLNARVAQLEAQFGLPSNHSSSSHAPPPLTSLPPPQASSAATSSSAPIAHGFVAYDVFSTAFLQPFLESCDKLGPDVAKYGAIVRRAFDAQRNYLLAASLSQKPTTGPVKGLLAPIQDAIREMHDLCDLRSNFANHQHMLYEGLQTLEWLHVDGAAPHAFMARYMGDVWGTKIRAQYKASNADQVRFAASFKALVTELMAYVEDFHPSGVTWNPDGGDVKDFLKPPSKRTKAKITLIRTLLGREPVKRNLNYSRQGTDEHDNLTKALAEWRADGEPVDKLSYRKKYGVPKLIWNTRTNANVNRRVSLYASPGITAVRMEQEEALVAKLKAQCHDNNIRWTAKDVQQYAVRDMGVSQISVRQWYSQHFLKRWPEAKGFIMRYKEAHGRETLTSTML